MNRDGTRLKKLTYNERVRDVDPMWSPDGRQIVFTTERDGNSEIYVMNADGSKQTNISRNRGDDFAAAWRPTC
jgi:Tol biopolymer transport system component